MFTVQHTIGKLVEIRISGTIREDKMAEAAARIRTVIGDIQERFVAVLDLRHARLFSQPVADAFIQLMGATNPLLERSAILIGGDSAVFGLQVERAILTARNPARRAFRVAEELETWLDEVLDERERQRLHEFLTEDTETAA